MDVQIIIGPLLGLLTVLGGVYTALQARKANKETVVVTGYDSLVKNLQDSLAKNASTLQAQGDRIVLLERRLDHYVRWGRSVIRWYESKDSSPLPSPHPILELNGDTDDHSAMGS
jgi:hypothetical protein